MAEKEKKCKNIIEKSESIFVKNNFIFTTRLQQIEIIVRTHSKKCHISHTYNLENTNIKFISIKPT